MSVLARRLSTCVHHHSRRASAGTLEQSFTSPCADIKLSSSHDDRPTLLFPTASPRQHDPFPLTNSPSPRQFEAPPVQLNDISQVKESHPHGYSSLFKPVHATSLYLTPLNEVRRSSVGVSTTHLKWTRSQKRRFSLDVPKLAKFNILSPLPHDFTHNTLK